MFLEYSMMIYKKEISKSLWVLFLKIPEKYSEQILKMILKILGNYQRHLSSIPRSSTQLKFSKFFGYITLKYAKNIWSNFSVSFGYSPMGFHDMGPVWKTHDPSERDVTLLIHDRGGILSHAIMKSRPGT